MTIRCPNCKKVFRTQTIYTKHYASAHYKKQKKAKEKKAIKMGKIPVWAKKRRK